MSPCVTVSRILPRTVSISTVYLQAGNYCWASGLMGVSTYHQSIRTRRACLSFKCALPGGLGKARSRLARLGKEKKQETRAGPGPPQQHQNVGCSSTWWTASPPKCHQVPLATTPRHGTPRAGAYGSAFPVTTGKQSQGMQPRPSAWDAPALRNAEAALTCGCTCCCKYAAASAHAHRLGREQQESWCRASCAPTTCPSGTECPMCLQERLHKGSRLPARRKQSQGTGLFSSCQPGRYGNYSHLEIRGLGINTWHLHDPG